MHAIFWDRASNSTHPSQVKTFNWFCTHVHVYFSKFSLISGSDGFASRVETLPGGGQCSQSDVWTKKWTSPTSMFTSLLVGAAHIFKVARKQTILISNFQEFLDSRAFGLFYCYESIFLIYLKIQISNKHKSKWKYATFYPLHSSC